MQVIVYTKPGCHLCEDVLGLLDKLTAQYRLQVEEVNILDNMELYDKYSTIIPVVVAAEGRFGVLHAPISETELRAYLELVRKELIPRQSVLPSYKEGRLDRAAAFVSKHWLRLVIGAMAIFVTLPWLAPVFAALGLTSISDVIYTAYALTCHQLPERSGTVFGYQVAFCYRNTAIYLGIVLFGSFYALARDRNVRWLQWIRNPLPWWMFALTLVPLLTDGLTHMLGLRDTMLDMDTAASFGAFDIGSQPGSLNWWLRIITGMMAALGVVWFSFSRLDRTFDESEAQRIMYRRHSQSGQIAGTV